MTYSEYKKKSLLRWLLCSLLLIGIAYTGVYVDKSNQGQLVEAAKQEVFNQANVARVKLESIVSLDIQMVRGLVSLIVNEPNLKQERFSQYSAPFVKESGRIKNLGAAPDMVLSMVYPLEGNEAALGLNYLTNHKQRDQAVLARDSEQLVMAGPLNLIQGGKGLIGRIPVFLDPVESDETRSRSFWGLISVVLDVDRVYEEAIGNLDDRFHLAMRHKGSRQVFLGAAELFSEDIVLLPVNIPGGQWELAVKPFEPWVQGNEVDVLLLRLVFAGVMVAIVLFFVLNQRWDKRQQESTQKLQANRDRFASLVSNIPGVTYRQSGRLPHPVLYVSEQIEQMTGYRQEEFGASQNLHLYDLIFSEDQDRVRAAIRDSITQGEAWNLEYRIETAQGSMRWIEDKGKAIPAPAGEALYLDGFMLDITERKMSEREAGQRARHNRVLAELTVHQDIIEGRFDEALNVLAEMSTEALEVERASIWLLNDDNSKMHCHVLFERSECRVSADMELSRSEYPVYFDGLLHKGFIMADDAMADPQTAEFGEGYLKPLNIGAMLDAAIFEGGNVCGVVCAEHIGDARIWSKEELSFLISIATLAGSLLGRRKREQAEAALREAKVMAEQAALAKSSFLATMSHEIRTPMNGVLGMLSVLEPLVEDAKRKEYIQIAKSSAMSLLTIIDDILDFSKIEAGKMSLEVKQVDMEELALAALQGVQLQAEEKGLELVLDTYELSRPIVLADAGRANQILINLLGNAIKFTRSGHIELALKNVKLEQGEMLQCDISDTGIGIPDDKLVHLFDAFSQVDVSTTRKFGGTGLGLAIVKQLVDLMKGQLFVSSCEGQGSTFSFQLPLYTEDSSPPPKLALESKVLLCMQSAQRTIAISRLIDGWGGSVYSLSQYASAAALPSDLETIILEPDFLKDSEWPTLAEFVAALELAQAPRIVVLKRIVGEQDASQCLKGMSHLVDLSVLHTPQQLFSALTAAEHSTFTLEENVDAAPTAVGTQPDSPSILVVEDNAVNQLVVRSIIEQLGFKCDVASNGKEAISLLNDALRFEPYKLVLMDCLMPEMDGYETTRYIRSQALKLVPKDVPIVALTANAMAGDKEKCHAAGMDDFASKPLSVEKLKSILEKWLG